MARLRGGLASQLGALRFRPYANDSLEAEFEERAIMNLEQPVRDVDAEIRIDSDQLGVPDIAWVPGDLAICHL